MNIWKSYKQERDCFVHFLRLSAVCWPSAQSARDNHVLACNFAKYLPIKKKTFTHRLSNKSFLIWLLISPPHLKCVATLPCNLSLMAVLLTLLFHKVMQQQMQCGWIFNMHLNAITVISLWLRFWPTLYIWMYVCCSISPPVYILQS